jgi:hypothetical protein
MHQVKKAVSVANLPITYSIVREKGCGASIDLRHTIWLETATPKIELTLVMAKPLWIKKNLD